MLVNNDILVPKRFMLNLLNKKAIILSCNTKIRILIKPWDQFILKKILVTKNFVIPFWTNTSIEVNLAIFFDRNFIFSSVKHSTVIFYYHMIDARINKIFA